MLPEEKEEKLIDKANKQTYHSKKESSIIEATEQTSEVTSSIKSTASQISSTADNVKAAQKEKMVQKKK